MTAIVLTHTRVWTEFPHLALDSRESGQIRTTYLASNPDEAIYLGQPEFSRVLSYVILSDFGVDRLAFSHQNRSRPCRNPSFSTFAGETTTVLTKRSQLETLRHDLDKPQELNLRAATE